MRLQKAILVLFLFVGFLSQIPHLQAGDSPPFVGSWKNVSGGFDDEMAFEKDGSFRTWLHSRPGSTGKWVLKGDQITITVEGFPDPRVITKWEVKASKLILNEKGEGKSVWKKLK